MSRPVRHHYLPVFYLKRWSGGDRRICEFSAPWNGVVKHRRVHPSATAYVDGLYDLAGIPSEVAHRIEELFLGPLDGGAARVLAKIERGASSLTEVERDAWAHFLLSLLFRMPEHIETLKRTVRTMWDDLPKVSHSAGVVDEDFVARFAMEIATDLMQHQGAVALLGNMQWSTIDLSGRDSPELLTSDRPVFATATLTEDDAFVLLPLGPRRLFVAVNTVTTETKLRRQPARSLAMKVNAGTVGHAVKYVYGSTNAQLRFVRNRMGNRQQPSFATLLARGHGLGDHGEKRQS